MQSRLDGKLVLLYTLLVLQVLIVVIYVATTPPSELGTPTSRSPVSFVKFQVSQVKSKQQSTRKPSRNYKTINGETLLKDSTTSELFVRHNHTLCFREGTANQRARSFQFSDKLEKCVCKQGWHGSDCGQPEVVWRAIMASKQTIKLRLRRMPRRLIHMFSVDNHDVAIAEATVEELYSVVDLFVICDFSQAEDNFRHRLNKGLLKREQDKILYVDVSEEARRPSRVISRHIWDSINAVVRNLREDDVYVTTDAEQVLNKRALMFLKLYDGWPQPIGFRLRWSVYGFFWQHPLKTLITVGACTISLTHRAYLSDSLLLPKELGGEASDRDVLGLVIGDLNHYGGWYCFLCRGSAHILTYIRRKTESNEMHFQRNIDIPFVEDLIGTGTWLDGKTSLLRPYKSQDQYYAPEAVLNNSWKYDWLLENFYAKLDYY